MGLELGHAPISSVYIAECIDPCIEMDILTDNSFVTICKIEMSPDEADMDLDLKDKLNATEVENIHTLHEGAEYKTISVYKCC